MSSVGGVMTVMRGERRGAGPGRRRRRVCRRGRQTWELWPSMRMPATSETVCLLDIYPISGLHSQLTQIISAFKMSLPLFPMLTFNIKTKGSYPEKNVL